MYGGISEPGMGTCPPRVRRDRGVSPRGNSRRSPPYWPRAGGWGALGQCDWGPENAGMKVICLLYYILLHGIYMITYDTGGRTSLRSIPPVSEISWCHNMYQVGRKS